MKTGIYIIRNLDNGKVYIGQSTDMKRRLMHHKRALMRGEHPNSFMQRSYDAHDGHFSFKVLEECSEDALDERERYWITYFDSMNRDRGYNRESGGHEGRHWSDESKEKRSGKGNPMYGKKQSPEFVEFIKMRNRASSDKLTESDVMSIKKLIIAGETQKAIGDRFGVTISTINKIATLHNWDWVAPELNDAMLARIPSNSKESRNEKLIEAFNSGKTVEEAAKIAGCGNSVAYGILSPLIKQKENDRKQLIADVRAGFVSGMSKEAIMCKYGISKTSYVRYTSDLYNERKQKQIDQVRRLRSSGMMVKDIAEKLGLHRTTVTEYCKTESR